MKDTFKPDNRSVSIEIDEGLIKIVEAQALKGKRLITGMISGPLPAGDPLASAEEMKRIFLSLKFIPRKIQINIPRHLVTASFIEIPSVDDHEISKMVSMESIKHLPYTDEKIVYGYRIIEKREDGYSRVLLVVAQGATISNFVNILNNAGIFEIRSLSLSSEALFLWHLLTRDGQKSGNVMLVNIDSGHIDIDVVEDDKLAFTRGVSYDINSSMKIEEMVGQINISMSTYQKESHKNVDRVILTGGMSGAASCGEALTKELSVPVEIIAQTHNVPLGEGVKDDGDLSFAELLALSLRPDDIKINLIPEDVRKKTRLANTKNNLITSILLLALFAALIGGLLIKKLHDKNVYLAAIDAELQKIKPKVSRAKKMVKDISLAHSMMARKPLAIDVVSEIYATVPGNISLSMLDFESGKSVTARGSSAALSDVLKYVTILENSPYFESVKVKYANKRMAENKEVTDFEIDALLTDIK